MARTDFFSFGIVCFGGRAAVFCRTRHGVSLHSMSLVHQFDILYFFLPQIAVPSLFNPEKMTVAFLFSQSRPFCTNTLSV